jgi:hypothetical protein
MKVVGLASLPSKGIQEMPRGKGKMTERSAQWEWKKSPSVNRAHESSNSIVNTIRNQKFNLGHSNFKYNKKGIKLMSITIFLEFS